jgi:hypothetical protein
MPNDKLELAKIEPEPSRPQQVLQWAMCHPGVLLLGAVAVGTALACGRETSQLDTAEQRRETEADIVDGDIPLFV